MQARNDLSWSVNARKRLSGLAQSSSYQLMSSLVRNSARPSRGWALLKWMSLLQGQPPTVSQHRSSDPKP